VDRHGGRSKRPSVKTKRPKKKGGAPSAKTPHVGARAAGSTHEKKKGKQSPFVNCVHPRAQRREVGASIFQIWGDNSWC